MSLKVEAQTYALHMLRIDIYNLLVKGNARTVDEEEILKNCKKLYPISYTTATRMVEVKLNQVELPSKERSYEL